MTLPPQEEKAVQYFMQGKDKTAAYKLAGYGGKSTHKTIQENACRFFKRSKIVARIEQLTQEIQAPIVEELKIDRKFITEETLDAIQVAKSKQDSSVVLKGLEMLNKMYDLNEEKHNDRLMSSKDRLALAENLKQRLLDVTPEKKE